MKEELIKYTKEIYYSLKHYFNEITDLEEYNTLDKFTYKIDYLLSLNQLPENKNNIDLIILSCIGKTLTKDINYKAKKNIHFGNMLYDYPEIYNISNYITFQLSQEKQVYNKTKELLLPESFTLNNCKAIIMDFYKKSCNNDKDINYKVINILNNIEIESSISKNNIKDNKIIIKNKPTKLKDLLLLVHKTSHIIRSDKETVPYLKEVEAFLTEKYFINYLYENKIKCIKNNESSREILIEDINNIDKDRMKESINITKRVVDELDFLALFNEKGEIDANLLNEYTKIYFKDVKPNIFDKIKDASKIKEIISYYYSKDPNFKYEKYNYTNRFDPNTNEQLSNQAKIIYAEIISEYAFNLNDTNIYHKYMNSNIKEVKDLTKILNINLGEYKNNNQIIKLISESFIQKYKSFNLINYEYMDKINSLLNVKENVEEIYKLNNKDGSVIIKK